MKDYGKEDGMIEFASRKIMEGYDIVIMGHLHKPIFRQLENGLYINLGDWITHNTYAVMEHGSIELKNWKQQRTR